MSAAKGTAMPKQSRIYFISSTLRIFTHISLNILYSALHRIKWCTALCHVLINARCVQASAEREKEQRRISCCASFSQHARHVCWKHFITAINGLKISLLFFQAVSSRAVFVESSRCGWVNIVCKPMIAENACSPLANNYVAR